MNERIKQLAKQAGLQPYYDKEFIRFAELVRQDERNLRRTKKEWSDYERAIAADEREACLVILETYPTVLEMIKAIRGRTE
jgi:hypothetical protein